MIPSKNNVANTGTSPLHNNFYSLESINVGGQDNNNFYYENNVNTNQVTHV